MPYLITQTYICKNSNFLFCDGGDSAFAKARNFKFKTIIQYETSTY
ncbi:hypothetical protein [Nonlabens dokdonensis]|uniref:Uncharacterized protein n=1 Tax=Nonlabens dokdonensis (strain DSM 17205 / KCTC 12402 / DSW-6) TaxID=592029 RepID=L7WF14_NONDD|nr:hypothetical protein [Nonlabens dokdonensis]AGC77478.1 hypothetical protein DDD_2351 [Nonlabens dokdonensis DSW-6]